jgi:ubiquitin-small subunit ribosomal protein S27Ae
VAKARVGLYEVKGETLQRTRKTCPKCGPGIFLAEHADRRSCGRCGYLESKSVAPARAKPAKPAAA